MYDDARRAETYAKLEFPGTYYLAYRDLPQIIGGHVKGRRAVDFGCGTGRSTRFLRQLGFEVVGVDIAEDMIRKAREVDPGGDYRLIEDGGVGPLETGKYDLVLSAFTFDNIPGMAAKVRHPETAGRSAGRWRLHRQPGLGPGDLPPRVGVLLHQGLPGERPGPERRAGQDHHNGHRGHPAGGGRSLVRRGLPGDIQERRPCSGFDIQAPGERGRTLPVGQRDPDCALGDIRAEEDGLRPGSLNASRRGVMMEKSPLEQSRDFLKDTVRKQLDFSRTDQNRGVPIPPIEKPWASGARLIDLPEPYDSKAGPKADLAAAIANRRSRRAFRREPLTLAEVSFLLWATQGVRGKRHGGSRLPHRALRRMPSRPGDLSCSAQRGRAGPGGLQVPAARAQARRRV